MWVSLLKSLTTWLTIRSAHLFDGRRPFAPRKRERRRGFVVEDLEREANHVNWFYMTLVATCWCWLLIPHAHGIRKLPITMNYANTSLFRRTRGAKATHLGCGALGVRVSLCPCAVASLKESRSRKINHHLLDVQYKVAVSCIFVTSSSPPPIPSL